jgi:hypothetical protein
MAKILLTVKLPPEKASLPAAIRELELDRDEIDANFGVVRLSPDDDLYAVMVDEAVAGRLSGRKDIEVKGPYANPRIEPFGPPKK